MSTLRERFSEPYPPDYDNYWLTADEIKQIRRALDIAKAVEEDGAISEFLSYGRIMRRADELEGKK